MLGVIPMLAQSPHGDELRIDCAQCHNASGWEVNYVDVVFDHGTTNFALEGAHQETDCRLCHTSMIFDEAPMDCASCHTDVHSQLVGNDCVRCHNSDSWLVDIIPELHEENGFPLIGAHANLNCVECHLAETNLRFDRIGNECISCHLDDYVNAENPRHDNFGFSTECTECHNPLGFAWDADPIAHDFFPLTMGHDIQDCNLCHTTNNFADASPDCVGCHQDDYTATANPSHQKLNLSNDCAACHTTELDWMPAKFDIHNDFYALNGAHADIAEDCAMCHNGNYNNTPNTCFGCHQNDYNDADDPDHQASMFPTDCTICHNEDDWEPADFNHDADYFPIFSGSHNGVWNECIDCHTTAGNFTLFACTNCHRQSPTASLHVGVNGYVYENNACLQCHPDGEE
ncbi:MAG: hypothetical protein AAF587_05700 [Bacteroidota bacterium]